VGEDDFDAFFQRVFPAAARLAYRIIGDREAAKDIAAEACARALARWGDVGQLGHRDAWILRVSSNLALDALRRRPTPLLPQGRATDVEGAVALRLALAAALRRLPRRQREVVVLRYLVGLPDREVADALGIEEGTVRTHARRGLGALRSRGLLGQEDGTQ
jgi:RNA polymerase sigma-70 factor (sigma-E family)